MRIRLRDRIAYRLNRAVKKRVICKTHYERKQGPISSWFSLSYCSYYVVPRLALEGMPLWWQHVFLWLVNMLPNAPHEYACQRRDTAGRFIKDPWANYRRGNVDQILVEEAVERLRNARPGQIIEIPSHLLEEVKKRSWTILKVENGDQRVEHSNKR